MNKAPYVGPFLRIIASVYDFFLLLGVWFLVGSFALWFNGGETLNSALGILIVFISSWAFFAFFWIKNRQTLGMQVWKFKIINIDESHKQITLKQTFLRYIVNCAIVALLGLPLFLIYVNSKKLAVNDILSKTKLEKI
tara:strand:+ start:3711 stop:4124 length:414 start_codon:yes stop_codon:yes gene_type:complete